MGPLLLRMQIVRQRRIRLRHYEGQSIGFTKDDIPLMVQRWQSGNGHEPAFRRISSRSEFSEPFDGGDEYCLSCAMWIFARIGRIYGMIRNNMSQQGDIP
ncbi:hypothetical protein BH24GEM2_BH24GEM2_11840 [soil metagenome]